MLHKVCLRYVAFALTDAIEKRMISHSQFSIQDSQTHEQMTSRQETWVTRRVHCLAFESTTLAQCTQREEVLM